MFVGSVGHGWAPRGVPQAPEEDCAIYMGEDQQLDFQKAKDMLISPLTMISPINGLVLTIYFLNSTNMSIDALLHKWLMGSSTMFINWASQSVELRWITFLLSAIASHLSLPHRRFVIIF